MEEEMEEKEKNCHLLITSRRTDKGRDKKYNYKRYSNMDFWELEISAQNWPIAKNEDFEGPPGVETHNYIFIYFVMLSVIFWMLMHPY